MLNDLDLEKLNNDLSAITQTTKTYQKNLQIVLERFQDLLERYNSLKSDYEEEKAGRERYKRQVKARALVQDRNPFVLVLIDGDGCIFKDDLIKAGAEGGDRAAQILSDLIRAELPPNLPDNCRIMVRIYADVFSLSAMLARANLVGREARSFSKFTSSFTRAQDLFDFVDVDAKMEGAKSKIKETFRLFVDNHQCKHIFFGGCHDGDYVSMLAPYRDETNRITLIKAANTNPEYEGLGLSLKELPSVFMSTSIEDRPLSPIDPDKPVCTHFFKGTCKFGASCTKSHVSEAFKIKFSETPFNSRSKSPSKNLSIPSRKQSYAKLLPKASGNTTSRIPVDKDGSRIDTYAPPPSDESFQRYKDISPRPCNKYHLLDCCNDTNCSFAHGHVEPEFLDIMRYQAKRRQCHQGRDCRVLKCIYGHHCQIDGCTSGGSCKMSRAFHNFDPRVARWVEPDNPTKDAEQERFKVLWNGTNGGNQIDTKDKEIEEFKAMWSGTGGQTENPQSISVADTANESTSPDLLAAEETASNFSIEW